MARGLNLDIIPVGDFAEPLRYFTHRQKTEYNSEKPAVSKAGIPLWVLTVTAQGKIFNITVPLPDEPQVPSLAPLKFTNLIAGVYNGNLWFRADDVDLI